MISKIYYKFNFYNKLQIINYNLQIINILLHIMEGDPKENLYLDINIL